MTSSSAKLLRAATFAAQKHRDQRRKDVDASPYINHPLAVATLLADEGGVDQTNLLLAALLHDTVEDTATEPEELEQLFGREVRELVAEVTDDKSLPKTRRKALQIEHAPHKSEAAKQLKLADKISNIRDLNAYSPAGWSYERKAEYLDWAEQVVAGCCGVNEPLERLFDSELASARQRIVSGKDNSH